MSLINYGQALKQAQVIAMRQDPSVFIMGIGVDDHKAIFGSTKDLVEEFGSDRVFDTPIAEGGMTGVAIGAALAGMKPIHIHIRMDFLYLAMDQIFNIATKWRYMFGGQMSVPLTIRAVIGRSWGQGAQHSQSLQSFFMHVPGIKVVMPTTAYDAKGYLLAAIFDPNPVLLIEHRLLYDIPAEVPDGFYTCEFGKTIKRRNGKDITIVANSYLVVEALKAAEFLEKHGIDVEILDPVTLSPLDDAPILESIRKTGRLLVLDTSWATCGMSAEISSLVAEKAFYALTQPIKRLGNKATPCPVSKNLENEFYVSAKTIVAAAYEMMEKELPNVAMPELTTKFKGPF